VAHSARLPDPGPRRSGRGGRSAAARRPRQRAVLAILLLHANRVVPVEELLRALYADAAPTTAPAQVRDAVEAQALGGLMVRLHAAGLDVVAARDGPRVIVSLDEERRIPGASANARRWSASTRGVADGELRRDRREIAAFMGRRWARSIQSNRPWIS